MNALNRGIDRVFKVAFLVFGVLFSAAFSVCSAQSLWTHRPTEDIKWYRLNEAGTLLVGTNGSIYVLDPETGQSVWTRDDFRGIAEFQVQEIPATPLLLVPQNSGTFQKGTKLYALDILTGKTVWETEKLKGVTVQVTPIYEKDMVVILTVTDNSRTQDKPDLIALKLSDGTALWESEFTDNVDLYGIERGSKFFPKYDLSGANSPIHDDDSLYMTYAGLHRFDLATGKLVWKVAYDVTEGKIKRGNAQAIVDGDLIYTSAKGVVRAIDKATGAIRWVSKDFGGAVAEMQQRDNVLYSRLGGTFYDFGKREYVIKKPLGVAALDKKTGATAWFYDKADDSITNMALFPELNTLLVADSKNLIGLDTNSSGKVKETFKVKLEFKLNLGAAATAAKVGKFAFGGLSALGSKGADTTDEPVAIIKREAGTAIVRGKQHLIAFDPRARQIVWSTKYAAPGVPGWQKIAMTAITVASAFASQGAEASLAAQGFSSAANRQNQNFVGLMSSYEQFMEKRYSATKAEANHVYVLTDLKIDKEKGAGLIGVNMNTGQGDRQILFKDKEPDYEVDEAFGRVFNLKNSRELSAFVIK